MLPVNLEARGAPHASSTRGWSKWFKQVLQGSQLACLLSAGVERAGSCSPAVLYPTFTQNWGSAGENLTGARKIRPMYPTGVETMFCAASLCLTVDYDG